MRRLTRKGINRLRYKQSRYWAIGIVALLLVPQLKAAAATPSSKFFGTYLNEGKILIEIDIVAKDVAEGVTIPLEPGHIEKTTIPPGTTKLYLSSRNEENGIYCGAVRLQRLCRSLAIWRRKRECSTFES